MRRIESDCVDCPQGCIDCGRKRVKHIYCDKCGEELGEDEVYEDCGDYCESCYIERLEEEWEMDEIADASDELAKNKCTFGVYDRAMFQKAAKFIRSHLKEGE